MNFTSYLMDFYGADGIYPMGFTRTQINLATQLYKCRLPEGEEFCGDSVDRERVRDIILDIMATEENSIQEYENA